MLEDPSWLKGAKLEDVVMDFEELACHLVNLHHDCIGYFLRFIHVKLYFPNWLKNSSLKFGGRIDLNSWNQWLLRLAEDFGCSVRTLINTAVIELS